ncbi:hypothetical protein HELRODRAFT_161482 [Helobdella robusta]|uniref:Doublecortin domain-containing protein n=1 Tax=Helobdella robusta TaxID=6412 RepID=T1ERJ0_HELRO|nr:hypothetical protein HELRODRAFT_161482 [Helobdella robusta]ESO02238.1 hypothetical protein HELRODRAFT_161482 [Helobdella robusta]
MFLSRYQQCPQMSSNSFILSRNSCKKIILLRNGNLEFPGSYMIVSEKKYPNFNNFLVDLNTLRISKLPDSRANGKIGTKYIFTVSGCRVNSINQIKNGEAYVCCASNIFARLDYEVVIKKKLDDPGFCDSCLNEVMLTVLLRNCFGMKLQFKVPSTLNRNQIFDTPFQTNPKPQKTPPFLQEYYNHQPQQKQQEPSKQLQLQAKTTAAVAATEDANLKIVVSILTSTKKPRTVGCTAYDMKFITSINQVVKLIAHSLNINCTMIKEMFTTDGKPVMNLDCLKDDVNLVVVSVTKLLGKNQFEYTGREVQTICSAIAKCSRIVAAPLRATMKTLAPSNAPVVNSAEYVDNHSCGSKDNDGTPYNWVELKYNKLLVTEKAEKMVNGNISTTLQKTSSNPNNSISEKENMKF